METGFINNHETEACGRKIGDMTRVEKAIEKASKQARELENKYNAPVVWMGENKFIIVKGRKEIMIEI